MEERSTAYFALYHLLKRSADFDRTFEALDMANKLSRHMQPLDVTGDLMLAERVASVFTADFLEGRAGQGFDSPGPIFVLGMPRSGTTLVEQILAAHPTVHPGEERFDMLKLRRSIAGYPMSAAGLSPRWAETAGRQVFNAMFAEAGDKPFATDKLPANYLNIGLIRWILPRAKFVYCLRTPEDNALSIYEQNFGKNIAFSSDLRACGLIYRDHLRLMKHWQENCRIPIHTVNYEALVADPESNIRALLSFLDLPWHDECLAPELVKRGIATASVWQVRQPIGGGSVGKWRRFAQQLQPFSEALQKG